MKFEVGKEYVSDEYGVKVKVNVFDGDTMQLFITESTNKKYPDGFSYVFYKTNSLVKSLKPLDSIESTESAKVNGIVLEVGKTYANLKLEVAFEVTDIEFDEYGDVDNIEYKVIGSNNTWFPVGKMDGFSLADELANNLTPFICKGENEPVLIKKYDYIRLPLDTLHLYGYINDLLGIYNTVSIQKTVEYYILQCERLEDE